MRTDTRAAGALAVALALSACQPRPVAETAAPSVSALPRDSYARLAETGAGIFRLAPEASRIDIVVRREGPLARFGHDHVIVAEALDGLAADWGEGARADVHFALEAMAVDPPEARARHGLTTEPSAEDIEGTRENMLDATLEASTWPAVRVAARLDGPLGEGRQAALDIEMHGRRHALETPLRVERTQTATTIHAHFELRQSDFGIEPYSALGGGLRVADTLELHAELRFVPAAEMPRPDDAGTTHGMHGGQRSE